MDGQVTILIYTFPEKGNEGCAFRKIVAAIERTWENVGKLKTVIVASHHFADVDNFASQHSNVELQIESSLVYGSITTMEDLEANLAENCVPVEFMEMDIFDYALFLDTRRTMMAQYIRDYYKSLD